MSGTAADISSAEARRQKKRKGWQRFFTYLILLIFVLIIGGFLSFAHKVDHQSQPSPIPKADGIVVWTGKGGDRLQAGAKLLADGYGERLLISGVNQSNDRAQVIALLDIPDEYTECCIDLDYAALDTAGNAVETYSWTKALGYEHIILVTSAYHMPRAKVELAAANGRIRITPYPVKSNTEKRWWNHAGHFKRLGQEYSKLLLTYMRRVSSDDHRGAPVLDTIPEKSRESAPH